MAKRLKTREYKQNYVLYTVVTAILLSVVFLITATIFYQTAEEEAYENLHVQTKEIKDDITLQLISDCENLSTMANFAAKLYSDGEGYDLMFSSFESIGLITDIGILNADNTFVTRKGITKLDGRLSFANEVKKGEYISGRVKDVGRDGYELIRSAVPIKVKGKTVGILYGAISLEKLEERYGQMAKQWNAQLFVYHKETGDLVIDTVHDELGNISFLKERKYNKDYSYEEMMAADKGFTSFESAYRDENLHLHYSTIDDLNWVIALGRYDSQVFAQTDVMVQNFLTVFLVMINVIALFIGLLMTKERQVNAVTTCAADTRKILLETAGNQNHIVDALRHICIFSKARSVVFFDTAGEDYRYIAPKYKGIIIPQKDNTAFMATLFRYAVEANTQNETSVCILQIEVNKELEKSNPTFYQLLKEHRIAEISFSATLNKANHITILAVLNSKNSKLTRMLIEKVAACFSMALYNKNHLRKTEISATTDGLTGAWNRVSYKNDLRIYDEEQSLDFSCLYVDVNELHSCNNKYGHAAGDEMLIYIANTLKEVFYGHKVYRMGGDEFLVFCKNTEQTVVKKNIQVFLEQLKPRNYHVAIGMSYRTMNTNTEEMVREAEIRMYEEKARYYQNKEKEKDVPPIGNDYVQAETGIIEIDTMLSVMKEKYYGIYRVSLDTDEAKRILMPAYLKYNENEEHFSNLFSQYVTESVDTNHHRAVMSFLNYQAIRAQLKDGITPKITFKKTDGEAVVLSVHKLGSAENSISETLWMFAKK